MVVGPPAAGGSFPQELPLSGGTDLEGRCDWQRERARRRRRRAKAAAEAAELAEEQGLLFADDVSPLPSDTGYRGPTACNAAGITYRQLDYWARTGLVEPSVRGAAGSGSQRLYSFRDILILKVVKRLLDAGISLQQIRTATAHLRERGTDDLTRVTLMSDGASVYECTSNDEVIDLLQGGQGVFGIAIGGVWREIEGTLAELPSERTAEEPGCHRCPATSSPRVAPPARPAEPAPPDPPTSRRTRRRPQPRPFAHFAASAVRLDSPALTSRAGESRAGLAVGRRCAEGAIPPRNLSGTRTARAGTLEATGRQRGRSRVATSGSPRAGRHPLHLDRHLEPSRPRPRWASSSPATSARTTPTSPACSRRSGTTRSRR